MPMQSVAFRVCAYQMGAIIDFDCMSLYVQKLENMPIVSIGSHMIPLRLKCLHAWYAILALAMRQQTGQDIIYAGNRNPSTSRLPLSAPLFSLSLCSVLHIIVLSHVHW